MNEAVNVSLGNKYISSRRRMKMSETQVVEQEVEQVVEKVKKQGQKKRGRPVVETAETPTA
jgi:hypothetical protein